jgi:hypothetical protein
MPAALSQLMAYLFPMHLPGWSVKHTYTVQCVIDGVSLALFCTHRVWCMPSKMASPASNPLFHDATPSLAAVLLQFMKMDVEGYEKHVMEGATALLQEHNVW